MQTQKCAVRSSAQWVWSSCMHIDYLNPQRARVLPNRLLGGSVIHHGYFHFILGEGGWAHLVRMRSPIILHKIAYLGLSCVYCRTLTKESICVWMTALQISFIWSIVMSWILLLNWLRRMVRNWLLNFGSTGYRVVPWYPKLDGKITRETQSRAIYRVLDGL